MRLGEGGRLPDRDEPAPARAPPCRARGEARARVRRRTIYGSSPQPEIEADVRIPGLLAGTYTPHCARVDPARLVRGLADACERRGVVIFERSPATAIEQGRRADHELARSRARSRRAGDRGVHDPAARARAEAISRSPRTCSRRSRCPRRAWAEIGWASCAPIADQRYQFAYAQRTPRRAHRARRPRPHVQARRPDPRSRRGPGRDPRKLEQTLRRLFPAAARCRSAIAGAASSRHRATGAMSGRLRPRDRPRPRRRVLGPRRRRVEPRRTHAGGPDRRGRDASSPACRGSATRAGAGSRSRSGSSRRAPSRRSPRAPTRQRTGPAGRRGGSRIVRRWLPGR